MKKYSKFLIFICLIQLSLINADEINTRNTHPENNSNVNGLGFLVKQKTVKLAISKQIQSVKLIANIGFSLEEIAEDLRISNSKILTLQTMPFVADLSEEGKFVNRHVNYIINQYSRVNTEISELLGYSSKIE